MGIIFPVNGVAGNVWLAGDRHAVGQLPTRGLGVKQVRRASGGGAGGTGGQSSQVRPASSRAPDTQVRKLTTQWAATSVPPLTFPVNAIALVDSPRARLERKAGLQVRLANTAESVLLKITSP